jgi:hypothetical protein
MRVSAKTKRASLHAVVTRADGRVEDLGMISYYHRFAPWRWAVNLWIAIRRRVF